MVSGLLGVTVLGIAVAGVFDIDPIDVFIEQPSTSGLIHYWAFMVSSASFLVAVFQLRRLFADSPGWQRLARPQLLFAGGMLGTFVLLFTPAPVGLVERLYLLVSLVWVLTASGWLAQERGAA